MAAPAPPGLPPELAPPPPGATMAALTFRGKCSVACERVPVPALAEPTDVLLRVDLCGVCGSDLHPYHCREEGLDIGTTMGHEMVGRVVAAGATLRGLRVGTAGCPGVRPRGAAALLASTR